MARNDEEIQTLRKEIHDHENKLSLLQSRLSRAESQGVLGDDAVAALEGCNATPPDLLDFPSEQTASGQNAPRSPWSWPLSREEYKRYGRQMITPEIGLEGKPTITVVTLSNLTMDRQVN